MSPPTKQNKPKVVVPPKNKKRGDSARPKPTNQSSSTFQPSEPATSVTPENGETNASNSTFDDRTLTLENPEDAAQLGLAVAFQNHQEFLFDKYLTESRREREDEKNQSDKMELQKAITIFQAEIRGGINDLSNLPSLLNNFDMVVADAKEKILTCETYLNDLKQDHTTLIGIIIEKMKSTGEIHTNIGEIIDKTVEQQKFFDRKSHMEEQKLDKINTEIDFITKERDELVHRIGDANKVIKEMEKIYSKLCKTNKKLKENIEKKKRENEVSDDASTSMNRTLVGWIKEKKEIIQKLDEEEVQLMKEQAGLMASLDNAKAKYKNVCQEEDELTIKTAEQENLIARIKTANKNLRHDDVEFQDKFSQLSIELKKITDENAEIQQSVDKKQQQWDTYKLVQDAILKKQQNRTELQSKLNELKKENGDIKEQMTKTRKSINDLKVRENLNDAPNLDIAKRLRLSSNTTTDELDNLDLMSNSSSVHLRDLQESDNENSSDYLNSAFDAVNE